MRHPASTGRSGQVDQDRVPAGRDHGGFGGSDGTRDAEAQQGGAVSGEAAAGHAGRARIRHSQRRLARTLLLLAGQGRRDHGDATELRDDPALRLATGDQAGTAPLGRAGRLPSQPTLSRRVAAWSAKEGVEVLRDPSPGPCGPRGTEVSPSASERLGQAEQLLLSDPKRLVFGPPSRPDLPSRVARGPSAPHPTRDPEVHE